MTMTMTTSLEGSEIVGLPRQALHALCYALYRDLGGGAAAYLQEAGFNSGTHEAFEHWLSAGAEYSSIETLDASRFGAVASEFFSSLGWGSLAIGSIADVATVDSEDWAEGNPSNPMPFPACYLTAGMLADFFSRLADMQLASMEVECRSAGDQRCRFLVGSVETIQRVYEGVSAGIGYGETLGEA